MFPIKYIKIRSYVKGLYFRDGEFQGLLHAGRHLLFDWLWNVRIDRVSQRDPWLQHEKLDMIIKSGVLKGRAVTLDLNDYERGLVWIDGRFSHILPPGQYAYWTGEKEVRVEVIDARNVRFEHADAPVITKSTMAGQVLDINSIDRNCVGVLFYDGKYVETVPPGQYTFWKRVADVKLVQVDTRETTLDISGQDIMTADKVTLRLNAVAMYRIVDARRAVTATNDLGQTLYREAQLALRAIVGSRDLDTFLADKDSIATETAELVRTRATELGIELISIGIRDVILPGEMKDLMNKVTEAKKAAEANLISRREETAAIRSQANTAKLLADNPTLMRLRELEVLEKIATTSDLKVVLGEKGPAEQVVNLI